MIEGSLIWIAWPVVAAAVICWQRRRRAPWQRVLVALALATYAWLICSLAFFPIPRAGTVAAMIANGDFDGRPWVNLVPLRALIHNWHLMPRTQIIREFGGNVVLFIPFTLVVPVFWPRRRIWLWPLVAGLGGSVAIELIQLILSSAVGFPYRQTDIDDVIVNTCGAFAGYAVFATVHAVIRKVKRRTAPVPVRTGTPMDTNPRAERGDQ